ncbi:MAG: hypothetical protein RMJ98_17395 [Myxococcales bacterium]|nr:hypothetical protein [Polyangiaceae bacterium]MDW8251072.1 hypothetical protein [Myxococcales bacterium]
MAVKKLTIVAQQAVGFAELFRAIFADGLQGPVPYRVELSEPDGPSTAGGKLALQHIKLIPVNNGATLVIGAANTVEKTAELRSFSLVAHQHAQRFKGATPPIDPQKFDALLESLRTFFSDRGMTVTVLEHIPVTPPMPEERPTPSPLPWIVLAAVILALIGAGAFWYLQRPHGTLSGAASFRLATISADPPALRYPIPKGSGSMSVLVA